LSTGATITAKQITGIGSRAKSLRFTGAAGNTGLTLGHRIESANCADFKNQTVTVSLKSKVSSAMTVTWTASYATVSDTFTTVTTIATGTINITTSVADFSFSFNAGVNAPNGLQITFATTALLASATIDFDQMQIEKSSVATEFQARPVQQELDMCQRYWEYGLIQLRGAASGNLGVSTNYSVAKRASPTITLSNTLGSSVAAAPSTNAVTAGLYLSGVGSASGFISANYIANARL